MKRFVKYILILLSIITTTSCSHNGEREDKIITDLNDIFDPKHESDTDWNYTEIDEDWLSDFGLYYDNEIKAYRQKNAFKKNNTKSKPINPITLYITLSGILFLIFEIWLLYATYQHSYSKHRMSWLWLINSLIGGIGMFIILSLSHKLKYNGPSRISGAFVKNDDSLMLKFKCIV